MSKFEQILTELHEKTGICGHCGKAKCAGKQSNSKLPSQLPTGVVLEAIERALGDKE